jgi:F-type H+-transporting ATPase subunit a
LTEFTISILLLLAAALVAVVGFFLRRSALVKLRTQEAAKKGPRILSTVGSLFLIIGGWRFTVGLLSLFFGSVERNGIFPLPVIRPDPVGGVSVGIVSFVCLGIVLVLVLLAVLARLFVVPRMKDKPKTMQAAVETFVDAVSNCMDVRWSFVVAMILFSYVSIATVVIGLKAPLTGVPWNVVSFSLSAVVVGAGCLLRRHAIQTAASRTEKSLRHTKRWGVILMVAGSWSIVVRLLSLLLGMQEKKAFHVSIWAGRVQLGIFDLSETMILTWIIMAILIVLAIAFRIFVVPRMQETPKGWQTVLETAIGSIADYTNDMAPGLGDALGAYIFTIAVFLVSCSVAELFGVRVPTSDLTLTFAMALVTFFLINYYGLKRKGFVGRIKSLASPSPLVFPLRVISDIAIPISLACRLFGNMLGGLIVVDLLYFALGTGAVGISSVIGLYFNVFHPLIQAFIFITLSLTFINEAAE